MKPKLFIGSSTEHLEIAYALQEGLDRDAEVTVWTQGIFKLSSTALDSLIKALKSFDFAIFVFHPDDITQIRGNTVNTVRDNLIFELGLFIGNLGREKVFFLIPRDIEKLHLPTDLLGIIPGTYDSTRADKNILASLGPFCNQIRSFMRDFIIENIEDIQNEPLQIKKIVVDRKEAWEYLFAAELMQLRLKEISQTYKEIENETVILSLNKFLTGEQFFEWYNNSLANFKNFLKLFTNCISELNNSFGPPGVPGKPLEIKNAVERIIQLSRELLNWEFELARISPPDELLEVKSILRGCTKGMFFDQLLKISSDLKSVVNNLHSSDSKTITISINLYIPFSAEKVLTLFSDYLKKQILENR